MEERKAFSSGTEEMRVGVNVLLEVVMLSGWQCQEIGGNEGSVTQEHAKHLAPV